MHDISLVLPGVSYFSLQFDQDLTSSYYIWWPGDGSFEVWTDLGGTSIIWPIDLTHFNMRIHGDSSGLQVKIWALAEAEPDEWTISQEGSESDPYDAFYYVLGVDVRSGLTGSFSLDSLDIKGINRVTNYKLDNFNRTVVPDSWGTSDTGFEWSTYNPSSYGSTGVDGANGFFVVYANDASIQNSIPVSGPWSLTEWTMTCRFKVDTASFVQLYFFAHSSPDLVMIVYVGSDSYGNQVELVTTADDVEVSLPAFDDDSWYILKWHYVRGGTWQAKVWKDCTTEPAWQIEASDAGDAYVPHQFAVQAADDEFGGETVRTISIDYIDFDYVGRPCYLDEDGNPVYP
jgi:hypothetical protein